MFADVVRDQLTWEEAERERLGLDRAGWQRRLEPGPTSSDLQPKLGGDTRPHLTLVR